MRKNLFLFPLLSYLLACSVAPAQDNVKIHTVETEYQNGKQEIRVLLPDDYRNDNYYRVLYVLPVEKGFDQRYGYGLGVLEQMDAHNMYDLIVVQTGFEKEPWYGDHATDIKTRQASYLKESVVPFVEKHYSAMGTLEGRLLVGFSKSGWGAFSLVLTYPEFFGYAASWDAPMFFDKFHYRMEPIYGTLEQLNIFRPDLLVSKQRRYFRKKARLVLTGEQGWGRSIPTPNGASHTAEMHQLLDKEGIQHVYDNSLRVPHRWTEQWMATTLEALMGLIEDPVFSHNEAVAEAEELKERIELAEKPWSGYRCITKGQIDIRGDGQKSQIDVFADGLGFWSHRLLTVKTPGKPDEVRLYMYWDGQDMYDPPHLGWSKNADDPFYATEREFLENIKYAYRYMPEEVILAQPENPKYAVHFWGKDNGRIEEGRLTIRRYKGKPVSGFSESNPRWEEGSVVFAKSSRGSLFGYNREVDEHFLLFHCDNKYEGPSVLAKLDTWLLVGLWGEGLVAVDLADYYLKRFKSVKGTVGKIAVTDSYIILDDGRHRIPLPIEKSGEKTRPFYFGPRGAK
ncbi:MAG: hypothetical protein ISS79_10420 [Phycisphaerae bacterium]|nr:hypothetical protein [Phycisphaerae bacterium]